MKLVETEQGYVLSHVIKGVDDEGNEVNLERNEWQFFKTEEEARAFGENRLQMRGIEEEIIMEESVE